jgi:uncharacterized protein YdeI (BOF family)
MKKYLGIGLALVVALAAVAVVAGCGAKTGGTTQSNVYGKAIPSDMTVTTAREIAKDPQAWEGKDVLVAGKITSECPSGGWVWVQDSTGQVYVNMHPTNVFIPQHVNGGVRAMGKVVLESGQPQVVGYALELK